MQTEVIETIAQDVRYWAEGEAESRDPLNARDLNCWCAIASGKLYRELVVAGLQPQLNLAACDLGSHVFLTVEDHVVDVTATQFPEYRDVPVLIVHEMLVQDLWYYQCDKVFATVEDLIQFQKKARWPREQIAWAK
jgi:hypothetical protein